MPESFGYYNWTEPDRSTHVVHELEIGREYWVNDDVRWDPWMFWSGRPIEGWNPRTKATYTLTGQPLDLPATSDYLPIHSRRLQQLIQRIAPHSVQYLPIQLVEQDGRHQLQGYAIANVLNIIDCLDRAQSIYRKINLWDVVRRRLPLSRLGDFESVLKVVIDPKKAGDARLFRLAGSEIDLIAREDLVKAIKRAKITGGRFVELEEAARRLRHHLNYLRGVDDETHNDHSPDDSSKMAPKALATTPPKAAVTTSTCSRVG